MKPILAPLALVLPLALAACDDGSDRIAELERERTTLTEGQTALTTERDELVTLRDTLTTERDTLTTERDGLVTERDALTAERDTLTIERDTLVGERDGLQGQLDAAQAKIVELEGRAAAALDAGAISEPLNNLIVRLREADEGVRSMRRSFADDDERLGTLGAVRRSIRQAGREIEAISRDAQIELEQPASE